MLPITPPGTCMRVGEELRNNSLPVPMAMRRSVHRSLWEINQYIGYLIGMNAQVQPRRHHRAAW